MINEKGHLLSQMSFYFFKILFNFAEGIASKAVAVLPIQPCLIFYGTYLGNYT